MFQVVECAGCGFQDLGWTDVCPECGAALCAVAQDESEDPVFGLNLVESGEVTYQAHLQHTVAYLQLREICEAAHQDRLSEAALQFLLAELEVYLEREILGFEGLECELIQDGLRSLQEACGVAAGLAEQGKSVLVLAERIAAEGDVWVTQGRQQLVRGRN